MSEPPDHFATRDFERAFGTYSEEHDRLHLALRDTNTHFALSETQYFSFCVPEERIMAFLYLWAHPNLNSVTAGAFVFQGIRPIVLSAELHDYQAHMPLSALSGDLDHYVLPNSYSIEMAAPGKSFRARYSDPERGNSFDIAYEAVSEVMVWPGHKHFEQVMRAHGELVLRGKRYDVDCYSIRDRSWGEARLEINKAGPTNSWAVGTFSDDFAFCAVGTDHVETDPLWGPGYAEKAKPLAFGWVLAKGGRSPVVECRKKLIYDRATMMPERTEMRLVTQVGDTFDLVGETVAATPVNCWPNVRVPVCLTRWTCDGQTGWGEVQDAQWNDFLHDFAQGGPNG